MKLNVCPTCLPGTNLNIDKPELGSGERRYYCSVPLDKKTMGIGNDGWIIKGDITYRWNKTFMKIN